MTALFFLVAFIVGVCVTCSLLLGLLLISSYVRETNIRKRRAEREEANRSAYGDPWNTLPKKWSPTGGHAHLGKDQIGRRAA